MQALDSSSIPRNPSTWTSSLTGAEVSVSSYRQLTQSSCHLTLTWRYPCHSLGSPYPALPSLDRPYSLTTTFCYPYPYLQPSFLPPSIILTTTFSHPYPPWVVLKLLTATFYYPYPLRLSLPLPLVILTPTFGHPYRHLWSSLPPPLAILTTTFSHSYPSLGCPDPSFPPPSIILTAPYYYLLLCLLLP